MLLLSVTTVGSRVSECVYHFLFMLMQTVDGITLIAKCDKRCGEDGESK